MEFYEVIRTRRSVRSFKPDPIPEDVLERILDAARIAPSGSNRQPWLFILVRDSEVKRRLAEYCSNQMFIAEAPVVVVVCGFNIHYNRGGYMGDMSMLVDCSIATTHLILAARAEGVGSCWIGAFDNTRIKKLLGIPEDVNVVAVVPLGYPKEGEAFRDVSTEERKQLNELVRLDRFDGSSWPR
jgi:nitroreductase